MSATLDVSKAVGSTERSWKIGVSSQEKLEAEEAIQRIKKTGDSLRLNILAEVVILYLTY